MVVTDPYTAQDNKSFPTFRRTLLFLLQNDSDLGRAISQEVSRWPLTAEAWFRHQTSVYGICGAESDPRASFFSEYLGSSPVSIIP